MKKLLILLLIPAALGGKFYLESRYEKELDKAIEMGKMFIDISYDKVNINLDGSLAIKDIQISSLDGMDALKIGSIEIYSNDKSYLYKGSKAFKDKLPELIRWKVNALEFDTDIGYFDRKKANSGGDACTSFTGHELLDEIGLDKIVSDLTLEARFSENQEANLQLEVRTQDFYSFTLNAAMDLKNSSLASTMRNFKPTMGAIDLTYSLNEQYAQNVMAFCAEKLNISPEEYLSKVVGSDEYMASAGVMLGEELKHALRQVSSGKSELHISAKPSKQVADLSQLKFYKPEDAIKLLNLRVDLDGTRVDDLSFTQMGTLEKEGSSGLMDALTAFQKTKDVEEDDASNLESITETGEKAQQPIELVSQKPHGYTKIKQVNAGKYIGYEVRVQRKSASELKGKLISASRGQLKIQQRRYGGTVDFPIKTSDINSIEVYL